MTDQHTESRDKRKTPTFSPTAVIAAGFASIAAAGVTSRFGVAGTLSGEALAAMISAAIPVAVKAYLDQLENATAGTHIVRSVAQMRASLRWFFSLSPEGRRPILLAGLLAGVVAFFLGIGTVTAAELGAGNSLPCWIWDNCPQDASKGTLPSVVGGGPSDDLPSLIRNVSADDEPPAVESDPGGSSPPIVGDGSNDSGGAPAANGGADKEVGPATTPKRDNKHEPCEDNETTTKDNKKDAERPTTVAQDAKGKSAKSCTQKTAPGVTNPRKPTETTGGEGTQGERTHVVDNHTNIANPPREESTVSRVDPPAQKENPPVQAGGRSAGQPGPEADRQNSRPLPEASKTTNGGA